MEKNKIITQYIIVFNIQFEFFIFENLVSSSNNEIKITNFSKFHEFLEKSKNDLIRFVDYRSTHVRNINQTYKTSNFKYLFDPYKSDLFTNTLKFVLSRIYDIEKIKIERVISFIKQATFLFEKTMEYIVTDINRLLESDSKSILKYTGAELIEIKKTFETEIIIMNKYFDEINDEIPECSFNHGKDFEESDEKNKQLKNESSCSLETIENSDLKDLMPQENENESSLKGINVNPKINELGHKDKEEIESDHCNSESEFVMI